MPEKIINKSLGTYNIIDSQSIQESLNRVINSQINYNTYVSPKGLKSLRIKISDVMTSTWASKVNPQEILITSGSQQSINLLVDALLKEKDTVFIEQPTYYGALDILTKKKLNIVGLPLEENGLNIEELETKIKEYNPKIIYVIPTFHNPTGYTWSLKKRKEFLHLINKYNILVIEDDPYSLINFTNIKYPSLYDLNKGKNIIYLGTFSKYISPSLNVGYIFSNEYLINKLYSYKESYDLCTSAFNQYFILDYLNNNNLQDLINKKIPLYKKQLELSLNILKEKYKEEILSITEPKGGLFYLVKFKNKINENEFTSGNIYYLDEFHSNETRINICSY